MSPVSPESARLELAFDLYETAEAMIRARHRREHPEAPDDEVEEAIGRWLRKKLHGAPPGMTERPPWPRNA